MVEYNCNLCKKTFDHKSAYGRHLNRQKSCVAGQMVGQIQMPSKNILNENDDIDRKNDNSCMYCDKIFTKRFNLQRHLTNGCKKEASYIKNITESNTSNELSKEINILKQKILELENKQSTITNTNNSNNVNNSNNNTNNGTINNIVINQYGKEDMSHITLQDFKGLFSRCNSCVPFFVELLHFNKDKPENNNIYISNMKSQYLMMYDGAKWKLADKNSTIDDMYDDKCEILINKYEDLKDHLDDTIMNKFNKFLNKYEEMKNNVTKDIKLVLYNNRNNI